MWKNPLKTLPEKEGQYDCIVLNHGVEKQTTRLFKKGVWFGGCRPFTDGEEVIAWKEKEIK